MIAWAQNIDGSFVVPNALAHKPHTKKYSVEPRQNKRSKNSLGKEIHLI